MSIQTAPAGELTEELLGACTWTEDMVARAGIPVVDRGLVSVGGGLGSFALADWLRVAGVPAADLAVLTTLDTPYQTYRYLAHASQIQDGDRLRSDSMSRADNIWGFPSYAVQEAFARRNPKLLWQVMTEPVLAEYYNPTGELLYTGVDREAARIGWPAMLARGQVRMVRKRDAGGYFTVLTPPAGSAPTKRVCYRSRFVHLAVGYPSLRFLPDLQAYRARYQDYHRVVNAYEPHAHVYEALRRGPGTVVVRGAGIVASRILQRLIDDRDAGARTTILHLFRTYVAGPRGPRTFRRDGGDGFTYQPFTFAKAAGGGQLREKVRKLDGAERAAFLKAIGGTTTARRRQWTRQLARGRAEGWYRAHTGQVTDVSPAPGGGVLTTIAASGGPPVQVQADFVIDATGLEGGITDHRVLADLLDCGAGTNPVGRLDVSPHFEVRGMRSGDGRIYASGSITLGGYLAPVDSFWGLTHAGLEICDELAALGFCPRIGVRRSVAGWWRWMRNTPL